MANIELARAYVTIVPSMQGARDTITDELTGAADSAGSAGGSRAGSAFAGAFGTAAQVGAAAVTAVATGVAALTTQAVNAYGEYEQLAGGIETLYGDASAQMMQYAQEAAAATGQDMNSYMEAAIATSASMISAVEGDQARAAQLTNQAMIDMSDNANKLGTDMEAIQNAYRGFSRGNFTMLDNLALGYAGTAQGMQQLLADARAISGVDYDISSYADIVEAIHVIQEEMGIAGTTANEASETITGSLGALGASWQNLITNVANPDADLNALIDNLVENAGTALNNLVPVISNALSGISQVIVTLAPIIAAELPGLVSSILPPLLTAAGDILMALGQGLIMALPALAPVAADLIVNLVTFVLDNLPLVIDAAMQIIVAIVGGIALALPELIPSAVSCVEQIVVTLIDNIDLLIPAALELMLGLALGLVAAIPDLLACIPTIADALRNELTEIGPSIANAAITWGADLIQNFIDGISAGIDRVRTTVQSLAQVVTDNIGFSEPREGPLSNFHTYAPDMVDLFTEGLEESQPELETALNSTFAMPTVANGSITEYEPSAGADDNIVIPINIGQERLDTIMLRSSQLATYRRGG